ncbi:WD40/YVTN/BNR-like repeat-containing protein [Salarchaeum japonicum]|uniref:Uncharacterized protein n=1 Tax=Salarchaeum japonicum TaxID=555573 RepID=A0AAV3T3B3_9EURY|nr:hypothetical protein [Salarchaeum japonicum]
MVEFSRRNVLAGMATAGVAAAGIGALSETGSAWSSVSSPTGSSLHDAAYTSAGAYAVGGSGTVLRRDGGEWSVARSDGAGRGKSLYACAASDDGDRLWVAGSSGSVGALDVASGAMTDFSKPVNQGDSFRDVAVAGSAGDERVYLAKTSGTVVGGEASGESASWTATDTGSGYAVTGVDVRSRDAGHVVTSGSSVYETTDGGATWRTVGLEKAAVPLYDVVSGREETFVAGANGQVFRLDCDCMRWTPESAGSKEVSAFERAGDEFLGAGGAGTLVERADAGWTQYGSETGNHLNGVALGSPTVVVGDSGTILER